MPKRKNRQSSYYDGDVASLIERYESADVSDLQKRLCKTFPKGGKLLELGCGSGRDASYMLSAGYDVVACDASSSMLDAAVVCHPELEGRLFESVMPAHLEFADEEFDGAYSVAMLMHLDEEQRVACFKEVYRVLKFDACFVFSVCLKRAGLDETGRDVKGRFFAELSENRWKDECLSCGLETVAFVLEKGDGLGRADVEWGTFMVRKSAYKKRPLDLEEDVGQILKTKGCTVSHSALRGTVFFHGGYFACCNG